jgi:hypothetical protein
MCSVSTLLLSLWISAEDKRDDLKQKDPTFYADMLRAEKYWQIMKALALESLDAGEDLEDWAYHCEAYAEAQAQTFSANSKHGVLASGTKSAVLQQDRNLILSPSSTV